MPYYDILNDCEMFEAQNLSHRFDPDKHPEYDSREDFELSILESMAAQKSSIMQPLAAS